MRCPTCKKAVPDDSPAPARAWPFCSERCKLIDLGRWLDGKYQIPVDENDPDEQSVEPSTRDDAEQSPPPSPRPPRQRPRE
jgi:endogenous inhibitor of DNA gyrase (YacG/DUF329 family)